MRDDEETKALMKQAIKEYISELVKDFGWFSLKTLALAGIAGIIYIALVSQGWHR